MNDQPLVSILCAAFNQEKYIAQTIEGFLMQKVDFPVEIIIHDDASTDRTADIIRKYEKEYPNKIKGIYQTENQYSKKVPIWDTFIYPKATGKYFAECEGDDYWTDPNKLKMQVDFLESHEDYVAIGHNVRIVDDSGAPMTQDNPIWRKWFTTYTCMEDRDYTLQDFEKGIMFGHSCTRIFRSSIQKRQADPNRKEIKMSHTNGDVALSLRCFCTGKVRCCSLVAADHRKSISNDSWTSKTYKKNMTRRDILSLFEQEEFANSYGIFPDFTDQQYRHVRASFKLFLHTKSWKDFSIFIGNLRIIKHKFKFLKRLLKLGT
ncbi:MAG: glycosyltransferase [Fibrobacter sp.]|nr:glycosyltransferase [Fibrobacter sp.]